MFGNFDFTCSIQLRKHLITHMDGNTYHCTICGNTFSTSKHLAVHMEKIIVEINVISAGLATLS